MSWPLLAAIAAVLALLMVVNYPDLVALAVGWTAWRKGGPS
jgi:hypothetical protein